MGTFFTSTVYMHTDIKTDHSYWANEASPILGYSIEISRIIYICVCMSVVCQINCIGRITWTKHAHAQSQPVLLISTIH